MADPKHADDDDRQRPGLAPFENVESAIRHEVEIVAERFPDTDVAVVDAAVHDVFADLQADAKVQTHLLALTRHGVYDRLKDQGHELRPPISDEEPADEEPGAP